MIDLRCQNGNMKKKKQFAAEPPTVAELGVNKAALLIQELWGKLREYEDRLTMSSRQSSKSPSSDSPADKAERKKLKRLVVEIRLALNLDIRGIKDH